MSFGFSGKNRHRPWSFLLYGHTISSRLNDRRASNTTAPTGPGTVAEGRPTRFRQLNRRVSIVKSVPARLGQLPSILLKPRTHPQEQERGLELCQLQPPSIQARPLVQTMTNHYQLQL